MENQAPYQTKQRPVNSTDSENLIMTALIHKTLTELRMDEEFPFFEFVQTGRPTERIYTALCLMLDQYGSIRELEGRKIGARLTETADIEEIIMEANKQINILKDLL